MAAFAQEQLDALVNGMYREGFLDEQFQQIRALDEGGSPDFLVELLGLFCADAERILNELTGLLNQPIVDYKKVDAYVHQLKGSSASVGAHSVKLTCMLARECCDKNDKEGCLQALNLAKQRFYELSKRFNIMIQLEQAVYACKAGK
ncbi:histidine-containing phosphotransfer protein 2-like [Phalaenopsis equestris]|uniref:histidine-containing phosphotransfer protein 2-like n=1 Tax=Phalaenopsis equestris TaxID=78828 RepID=UPI0009E2D5F7|nr:histidine-containing phosphotransfer protein 2-like [Phalaenopsis equestris]